MKMIYDILYKNGHVDVIEQKITEENAEAIAKIGELIQTSMQENAEGHLSLGDGKTEGYTVRLSEIARVKVNYISQ